MSDFDKVFSFLKKLDMLSFEEIDVKTNDLHVRIKKNFTPLVTPLKTDVEEDFILDKGDKIFTFRAPISGNIHFDVDEYEVPIIKLGSSIRVGQTICIIESDGIFNEIKSDTNGVVMEIFVENEQFIDVHEKLLMVKKI